MNDTTETNFVPVLTVSGIVIIGIYVAAQILADIGSLKIAYVFTLSMDAGTIIYPITFTLRDMIHKKLGKKAARTVIMLCALINLCMSGYFALISMLPQDPSWGLQDAFSLILGPVWRIVIASIIAEVVGELIDTEVYHLWVTKITRKYQWSRVLVSNIVSIPIDSILFAWIAFGGDLPSSVVWSIVLSNVIVKALVTLLSIPAIYLVKDEAI